MTVNRKFPTLALAVLVIGIFAVAAIAVFVILSSEINPLTGYPGTTAISIGQAKQSADQYIAGSPDLRVAEIEEYAQNFYVSIQEKGTGINAFELLVNKFSGAVTREPGPDMMWNTKYGMMGFGRAPTANMSVTADKAAEKAQRWLDTNIPGTKAETPDTYYGFYTIDISLNGSTYGMLSVNGYSGDVWYHTWHGQFITSVEYS